MRTFRIIDAPQRSAEWVAARLGKVTGSRVADIFASIKSGEAAARRDYRIDLVVERMTRLPADADSYISADMTRGIELEPEALAAYEAQTGHLVARSGFLAHVDLDAGCSLDGHIGDFEGVIEAKCPRSANHLATIRSGKVPTKYLPQITHALWMTGATWCDFVTFDPRFPEALRLGVLRVGRHDVDMDAHEHAVRRFLAEVDTEHASLLQWAIVQSEQGAA